MRNISSPMILEMPSEPLSAVTARVVIVGESGVGKSSLLVRFVRDTFSNYGGATIGVEFNARQLSAAERTVKLQCWDCAGAERFRAVSKSYFRGFGAAFLVFDLSSRVSFEALDYWLGELRCHCAADPNSAHGPPVILLANKCDVERRAVSVDEIRDWCAAEGITQHYAVSAKSGENVQQAFAELAQRISDNIERARAQNEEPRKVLQGLTFPNDIAPLPVLSACDRDARKCCSV